MVMGNCQTRRRVFAALFVFFILAQFFGVRSYAADDSPRPKVEETDNWRTGDIEVKYSHVEPGSEVEIWVATFRSDGIFEKVGAFTPEEDSGTQIVQFRENGQTVWYYIKQNGVRSNILKQTPPITAYIINWPDMLADLDKMLNDAIRDAMTPSPGAMQDLKNAVDNLKDASGAGGAGAAGTGLQNAINQGQGGMSKPIANDDGNGTFTGGATGGNLPQQPTTSPGLPGGNGAGLKYPDPASGTPTEMTVCLPYGVNMQGGLLKACFFTAEQMEKMKWMGLIRDLLVATIWVIFAIWLINRFTPQLKA